MEYGRVLYHYLKLSDKTVSEVAREIGSPRSTIYALISGRAKEPTLSKAKEIADALGVPLEDMVLMMHSDEKEEGQ